MSLGFKLANDRFQTVGAIDNDPKAVKSYRYNFPFVDPLLILEKDLSKYPPHKFKSLLSTLRIAAPDLIIGGPPCPWILEYR